MRAGSKWVWEELRWSLSRPSKGTVASKVEVVNGPDSSHNAAADPVCRRAERVVQPQGRASRPQMDPKV